jgi:O-antigen ligase
MPLSLHPYLRPAQVEFDLGNSERIDRRGDRFHTAFAVLCCLLLCGPTSFVEFAGAPMAVVFVLRIPYIWRTWGSFAVQPWFLAFLAWAGWQAITLCWTPDRHQGLHELSANRWLWIPFMLWPVMRRRQWLIAGLAIGMLLGNLSQVIQEIGVRFHIPGITFHRLPDRNSGWWDPVIGGSLLTAALGLHLPAALMGQGRWRWIGLGGVIVSLLGIGATGTRGAWLGAAFLCEMAISISVFRERPWKRMLARLAIVLAVTALIVGAVVWLKGDAIRRRTEAARQEIARAIDPEHPDIHSDTGARVLMAQLAVQAVKERPLRGVGAGGYRTWSRAWLAARAIDPDGAPIHQHAHSTPLHIAATTGLIGLALGALVVAISLYGGFTELGPRATASYAAGPAFALIGLLMAGLFDPVELNSQTAAVMSALMGLCLVSRPQGAPPQRSEARNASTSAPSTA